MRVLTQGAAGKLAIETFHFATPDRESQLSYFNIWQLSE